MESIEGCTSNELEFSPYSKEELEKLSIRQIGELLEDEINTLARKKERSFFYDNVIKEGATIKQVSQKVIKNVLITEILKMSNNEKEASLICSLEQEKIEFIKLLLYNGAPADAWNNESLVKAAYTRSPEIVDLLIKEGGEKVKKGIPKAIKQSIFFMYFDMAKYLLKYNPRIEGEERENLVRELSRCMDIEILKRFIPEVVRPYITDVLWTMESKEAKDYFEKHMVR